MLVKEDKAVEEVDILKEVLKMLKGIEEAPHVPVEEVEPEGPIKKEFKEGAEPDAGYLCNEFFQKKKKSRLNLEGQGVLDAIVDQGVEDEEKEHEEDEESPRIHQKKVKEEGVHEDELHVVEDQEHADDREV